jgi:hypothetical protein
MIRKETPASHDGMPILAVGKNARAEIDRVTQLLEDFCREIDKAQEGEARRAPVRHPL